MKLTYRPHNGEARSYYFDPDRMSSIEAETLEECGGESWDTLLGWLDKFQRGSFKAWRAGLWICVRRNDPTLAFDAFRIDVDEIEIEDDEPAEPVAEGKGEGGGDSTDLPSPQPALEPSPSN